MSRIPQDLIALLNSQRAISNNGSSIQIALGDLLEQAISDPVVVEVKTTTYTLTLNDANKFLDMTDSSPLSVLIPDEADVNFPIGTTITVRQGGTGAVTIAADNAATLESLAGNLLLAGQYGAATLVKIDSDVWSVFGALTSPSA